MSPKRHEDFYTQKAQKEGFAARSVYKLEELDAKFHLFEPRIKSVLDIGCAPGSRLQYASKQMKMENGEWKMDNKKKSTGEARDLASGNHENMQIIGVDLKKIEFELPGVHTYVQDATDLEGMQRILDQHQIEQFDLILSDMAPDTTNNADLDALRSIDLIERMIPLVERYLKTDGKFVFKVFMGPGFESLVRALKQQRGVAHIRLFKPKSSRKASKETFIVKV